MVKLNGVEMPISLSAEVVARMFESSKELKSFMDSYYEARLQQGGGLRKASANDIAIARAYLKGGKKLGDIAKQFGITDARVTGAVLRAGREAFMQLNK